ncbi:alanine--tRNA ligase [Spiroplasma culicicola]|uniref:Alanine--tRNA ligase n=1 Tax=Spiroplasma culicicola AES-1 TaxID=1276246 RepID=W6A8V3_9MOLU|nr:alanine--tRNA ligase [Spiroplasma culicicola]AHI53320.1 alanyl-tRNA synthetase [Spiroplasma culicicola AES-1]
MKKLNSNEIRQMWLDFFKWKDHYFLEPVSLVPVDDPSLLWINSGVATLKPYFDGRMNPPSPRLTNSQKSIRTNDIENVGITARHQTMFEMLGNFSIGDYFKKEAIHMAWELLTSPKWFDMDKELLYITVFEEDNDAYEIWTKEIGIAPDHIFKGTRETNFWDVGQGPCGPNTEIFFDRGIQWDPENIGPTLLKEDIENDRYIEIWNIVFSQFNNDGNNNYTELPRKNIDTGAGLERMVSIFQDAPTNFETDLFLPTIGEVEKLCDSKYKYSIENYFNPSEEQTKINTAFKVIADHIRAVVFAISDGVFPGNKDRGYIIRRLIRRSGVYGKKLGINSAFLYKLVDSVIFAMSEFYPYIKEKVNTVKEVIEIEENRFLQTLAKGYEHLENIIKKDNKVTGKNALLLFESFGFPIELTSEIATEMNVEVEIDKYNQLLEQAKEVARNSRKDDKAWNKQSAILTGLNVESEFVGYEQEEIDTKVNFMFIDEQEIKSATDKIVFLTLEKTPFYAEKGGQAPDNGVLIDSNGNNHQVLDVQAGPNKQHIHKVQVNGTLNLNDQVFAKINQDKRFYTMKNHSGTHILQSAIREVLGDVALQCGSYNDQDGLRLDITFNRLPTQEEIDQIHTVVAREIKKAVPREIIFCTLEEAIEVHNALAIFTDKYGDLVRLIKFGQFSCELCGGTHIENTKDLEDLFITNIESKGSGVYRYHAVTSHKEVASFLNEQFAKQKAEIRPAVDKFNTFKHVVANEQIDNEINTIMNMAISRENLAIIKIKVNELKNLFKLYQKSVEDIMTGQKIAPYKSIAPEMKEDINYLTLILSDLEMKEMKALSDELQNTHKNLVLKIVNKEKQVYIVSVAQNITDKFSAIEIFKNTKEFSAKGGGNTTFAQGKIV